MTSTRTPAEIVARIADPHTDDWGGFVREVLVPYLPFTDAQQFLKDGVTAEDWTPEPADGVADAAQSYYDFALLKIRNHRSLSADRSVAKLREYAWLLGRDDAVAAMDQADYRNYGAPKVKAFAAVLGYPWPGDEDLNRMAAGESCWPDCEDGCGR